MAELERGHKRRRAKVACDPCRERKRKCDSKWPCSTCVQLEYDCDYEETPSKLQSTNPSTLSQSFPIKKVIDSPLAHSSPTNGDGGTPRAGLGASTAAGVHQHLQLLEGNSGAAFVRRLGLNIDPFYAPRLHLFAWNTGDRLVGYPQGRAGKATALLSKAEMTRYAQVYFAKVANTYDFIDRATFWGKLSSRWLVPEASDSYDLILCGVALLGLHFSQRIPMAYETDLVETVKVLLEQASAYTVPTVETVTGWVLRVAHLRVTSSPQITWLASCSLMHVAEAASIHVEAPLPSNTVFGSPETIDTNIRRRLWGMAQHLNIWASYDLGRSKVSISGVSTETVPWTSNDLTSQIISLVPMAECLDPNYPRSAKELEQDMVQVLHQEPEAPGTVMAQLNLMLCIFRRLKLESPNTLQPYMHQILALARKGLVASQQMVSTYSPWHHAANIPFQIVCLLLAVDTQASLAILSEAMDSLLQVKMTWDSAVMREAYDTAILLVLLHQQRKEKDASDIRAILERHSSSSQLTLLAAGPLSHGSTEPDSFNQQFAPASAAEVSWLETLISDIPALSEVDVEQFLALEHSSAARL